MYVCQLYLGFSFKSRGSAIHIAHKKPLLCGTCSAHVKKSVFAIELHKILQ